MYSRFPREPEKRPRPPANYSGYAFSKSVEAPAPKPWEEPSPPQAEKQETLASESSQTLLPAPLPHGVGGLNHEDLLILGVILLLASDGGNQELLLWLLLLFFCK
ncbi:MAG: hypothetical protein E7620_08705 [Ruminococcaceae bacterium]|nr:hypothetical protein [Oscillospiraceae bacterium]